MIKPAVVILAAGKGTRMKSERSKVLFPLAGKPLIEWVLETSEKCCPQRQILVVAPDQDELRSSLQKRNVEFAIQEQQRGTGDAVAAASEALADFDGPVLILCGDVPLLSYKTLQNLLNSYETSQAAGTVLTAILENPFGYGRIVRDAEGNVVRIVEQRDANETEQAIKEINTGIYCFDGQSLFGALKQIDNQNDQGEYYLTDVVAILTQQGKRVSGCVNKDFSETLGVNSRLQLNELEQVILQRKRNSLMINGVSMENPETIYIDEAVKIAADVVLETGVVCKKATVIGGGSFVQAHVRLENVQIGEHCLIGAGSYLKGGSVPDYSVVSPHTIQVES